MRHKYHLTNWKNYFWTWLLLLTASASWGQITVQLGTGTSTTSASGGAGTAAVYNRFWESRKTQVIYTAAELNAAGVTSAATMTALALYIETDINGTLPNWSIKIKHTTATSFTAFDAGTFTTCYTNNESGTGATIQNWRTFTFSTPFNWNGTDNIVIEFCHTVLTGYNNTGVIRQYPDATGTLRSVISGSINQCPVTTGGTNGSNKPQVRLTFAPPCSGTPPTLTASVLPNPTCLSSTLTLSVPSIFQSGITYQWQYGSGSSWTNIAGATTATASVPMSSSYLGQQFRCLVTCTNSSSTTPSNPTSPLTLATPSYATLPVIESFEGSPTWASVCATRDVPNNNWRNTPVTGDASWRRNDDAAGGGWSFPTSGGYTPTAAVGNFSARFHSYGALSGQTGDLDLYVNLSTPGIKQISFFYINTSGTDNLQVQLSTDGGATFSTLGTVNIATTWTYFSYTTNVASPTCVVRFRATSDYGLTDIGLDGVSVQLVNMLVSGLNGNIVGSGSGPSLSNGTNFQTIPVFGQKERNFYIKNIGSTNITVSSITSSNLTNFPIITSPGFIAPGDSALLRIRFTASTAGTFNSTITINSNGVPNPYTFNVSGQAGDFVASYTFAQCSGTYQEITGGSVLFSGDTWDDNSQNVSIPSFTFNGFTANSVYVNTNGYIVVNGSFNTYLGPISSSTTLVGGGGVISGLGMDLQGQANSEIRYEQIGNEAVFQWKGVRRYGISGDNINFQIRLNTSTGQVRVVYGTCTTTSTSVSGFQVGLRGVDNTDFNNRTTATNWANSVAGSTNTAEMPFSNTINPPSGLTYTWSPLPFDVLGGTPLTVINNQDFSPSPVDGTDMGFTSTTTSISRTFVIRNYSGSPLSITSITSTSPLFTVSAVPSMVGSFCGTNIATFVVTFANNVVGGPYTADILINNNSLISPYVFRVQASVADPDINVLGNSVAIPNGSPAPSLANHTDFGNVDATVAPGYFERTFTIENTASLGTLQISSVTINNPRFTVVVPPASSVPAGGSTTMTIRFTPTGPGDQNAVVTINNNDPDENPYTFAIKATGVQPQMQVLGNGVAIPNNKTIASQNDATFIGVATSNAPISSTFTIRNTGNSNLNISSITLAAGTSFSIANAPTVVPPNSEATFNVVFSPTEKGAQDTVRISTNFPNIPVYRFLVAAGGVVSAIDHLKDGELIITPNPSTDIFNVQIKGNRYKDVKLTISDVSGRKLFTIRDQNFGGSIPIDMRNYGAGTYLLVIETNGERAVRKLIKQ